MAYACNPTESNNALTKMALKEAQKWHGLVSVIIKQAGQETEFKLAGQSGSIPSSFAEQISQLYELHKTGTITDDEFINAKKKLLS
jgi:hypothetical protein